MLPRWNLTGRGHGEPDVLYAPPTGAALVRRIPGRTMPAQTGPSGKTGCESPLDKFHNLWHNQ